MLRRQEKKVAAVVWVHAGLGGDGQAVMHKGNRARLAKEPPRRLQASLMRGDVHPVPCSKPPASLPASAVQKSLISPKFPKAESHD